MIEKMEKLFIYSLKGQTSDVMEAVLKCGSVQLTEVRSMLDEDRAGLLSAGDGMEASQEKALGKALMQSLKKSIESLESIKDLEGRREHRGLFFKRPEISYDELMNDDVISKTLDSSEWILEITDEMDRLKKEIEKEEFKRASYLPWKEMDVEAEYMRMKSCAVSCYILQKPNEPADIASAAEEREIPVCVEIISSDEDSSHAAVVYRSEAEQDVRHIVSALGGKHFETEALKGTMADNIAASEAKINELQSELHIKVDELKSMVHVKPQLEMACDALRVRTQCMAGRESSMSTDTVDVITGWVPTSQKKLLSNSLRQYGCCCEYREAERGESFPVLMKNSRLVAPFASITEMYSLPDSRSIDTNWAIGLFFFIFFGMMLSDAGYGLILMLGGFSAARLLDLSAGAKRFMKMIGICGISTTIWGIIYGSFFGDAPEQVAQTFFGVTFEIPSLIDPLNEPMTVLMLSCLLGVVHIFLGMGIKGYLMIRQGHIWEAVFDVGFWYVFLAGLTMLLLPQPFKTAGAVISIAGGIGLVLTQGRHRPTLLGKLATGVMSLYDITGYFSDVLSYSRILALGLATGVVASVVNIMGTMTGGGILGFLVFVLIFAAGHALNLGINALGAYVHSARLQYVEFFGKYYQGGGSKFEPLRIDTEYVRVSVENDIGGLKSYG